MSEALADPTPHASEAIRTTPLPRSPLEREFAEAHGLGAPELRELALIKRFVDFWLADDKLRARVAEGSGSDVAAEYALPVPLGALRCILAPTEAGMDADTPDPVRHFAAYLRQRAEHRDRLRSACAPEEQRFAGWRHRQVQRCRDELPDSYNTAIMHLPVAFELTEGCSVGCWFCGLSATGLETVFRATPENRQLWRQALGVVRGLAGPAAGQGICFWATDPLDNSDYETFCADFHELLGRFPATTTALAPKQLERARNLLASSFAVGCEFNRFSILSLRQLREVYGAFAPDELLYVDIIPQNSGALRPKALAGRVLSGRGTPKRSAVTAEPATIACVSGFLINMVKRSAKLISPCAASDEWPDGYRVFATGQFGDAAQLDEICQRMVADHMATGSLENQAGGARP